MCKFDANILWIATTSTTYGPQQFAKISVCKVNNFVPTLFLVPKLRSVAQFERLVHKQKSLGGKNPENNVKIPRT